MLFQFKVNKFEKHNKVKKYGTGFFINDSGYIITNHHVTDDGKKIVIRTPNNFIEADVIQKDEQNDLSLLHVDYKSRFISFSPNPVKLGQKVLTYGYPQPKKQGFSPVLTEGNVNKITGNEDDVRSFQFSAPINDGNSGGPLVSSKNGALLGIIFSFMKRAQNVNYAYHNDVLLHFLNKIPSIKKSVSFNNDDSIDQEQIHNYISNATVQIFSCK